MIVALSSVRGAPGASLWSMLLAAAWPDSSEIERVVFEADPAGGVAGARYGVGVEPGTSSFASMLRRDIGLNDVLAASGRRIHESGWLVPGPASPEAATRLWAATGAAPAVATSIGADPDRVWFCDLGRVSTTSPLAPFVEHASVALVLARDQPPDLIQIPDRVSDLRQVCRKIGVVVVGTPAYGDRELAEFVGTPLVWTVASDYRDVENTQRGWRDRRLRRSAAWRDAVRIVEEISSTAIWSTAAGGCDE